MSALRSNKSIAIVLSGLVWFVLACGALGGGTPAPSEPESITVQKDVTYGPGPFDLPDPTAGLSQLSSYRAALTLSFDGSRDGQPEAWSKTYVMLTQADPSARQLTIETTGDPTEIAPVFMAEADGAAYERIGEGVCNATLIDAENRLGDRLEPAGLLNYVLGADEAGSETVNDIAAVHYTFDQRALGQDGLTESAGEMWVASEGGYVVKYVLSIKGNPETFGEGIEGTLNYDYELTQVNQPVEIQLPAECPPGLVDAPQPPDATNVVNLPGVLSYDTASSLEDVIALYEMKMPESGWEVLGEPSVTDTDALLAFTRDDETITVNIAVENGVTRVRIGLTRAQPS